jgi:glycosyltransferase involved in cell wall biosynthesis
MSDRYPRVAFFACAYNEIDGVANTVHHFETYAERRHLPFLSIHGGYENYLHKEDTLTRVEFERGWASFPLDKKHDFDLLFGKYYQAAKTLVHEFQPDLVHITGPSDVGITGALIAHQLGLPLVASWHTNLHEYLARRTVSLFPWLPSGWRNRIRTTIEAGSLRALVRYYKIPCLLFAPNPQLTSMLEKGTGKPCLPMGRGVDVELFTPQRRDRQGGLFTLGYVGRITVEKDVGLLPEIEQGLLDAGFSNFRFVIVGQGAAEPWLRQHLRHAEFAGVLRGKELAHAYANMDIFVFPSRTDTYGNVVLEAMASGIPALVTDEGGPQFIVQHGKTGFVAKNARDFVEQILWLAANREPRETMSRAARAFALTNTWDAVFDFVYAMYGKVLTDSAGSVHLSQPDALTLGEPNADSSRE